MAACNVDCLSKYGCGAPGKINPSNGAVYAPWIKVNLGSIITVGNQSFPGDPHTAVVKSLDFGASGGTGVVIEIIDEAGTSFERYFKTLNKDLCQASNEYNMSVDFGWLARTCDGAVIKTGIPDGPATFTPTEIESAYEGGVIKYTIKGTDLMRHMGENRIDKAIGSEANKTRLRPAMRRLLGENCPATEVKFKRRVGPNVVDWNFRNSDGGPDGPMSVWPADQQNALAAIRKWGNSVTTDRRKGFSQVWNVGSKTPELWLLEDGREYCDEVPKDKCIGTYIVNGGNCSPVISFSPQAKWAFTDNLGSGGNTASSTGVRTPSQKRQPIQSRLCSPSAKKGVGGTTSQFPPTQNDINWRPPDLVAIKNQEALAAQELAAQYRELVQPISAELKIVGDNRFVHSVQWIERRIGIIVINPFHIFSGGGFCEWIAGPTCNSIYSDKDWMIMGVSHQISEGSFVTTFQLNLSNKEKTSPSK